jgi:hypothetical protein
MRMVGFWCHSLHSQNRLEKKISPPASPASQEVRFSDTDYFSLARNMQDSPLVLTISILSSGPPVFPAGCDTVAVPDLLKRLISIGDHPISKRAAPSDLEA